eukprot:CAMPEP_0204204140 /NCGR_PEP_ID=MMETSP0361-20130328/69412_1 /ASSEMBLY_ACC=CAM_ASM_000343 /TAXON_ID=268821 /ORGANISM="Scrippsiella Hangoei, Strain SHTV-5" /LENGTH=77 /DNA_ID=CAMNT_0051167193 /DNA_START=215 /DNA_END=448 /DNA_ORIENTATION=+
MSPQRTSHHLALTKALRTKSHRQAGRKFSASSSLRRRKSSYKSFNAVQSSTPQKGITVLCHIIGENGRSTMIETKRK